MSGRLHARNTAPDKDDGREAHSWLTGAIRLLRFLQLQIEEEEEKKKALWQTNLCTVAAPALQMKKQNWSLRSQEPGQDQSWASKQWAGTWLVYPAHSLALSQGSAHFFYKGPGRKYFRLCGPRWSLSRTLILLKPNQTAFFYLQARQETKRFNPTQKLTRQKQRSEEETLFWMSHGVKSCALKPAR